MPRRLFLDDSTKRHKLFKELFPDAVQVMTINELNDALKGEPFDEVWLDHDLQEVAGNTYAGMYGEQELTGRDAAKLVAMLPEDKRPFRVIVHSWNPAGANAMHAILNDAGILVVRSPFVLR